MSPVSKEIPGLKAAVPTAEHTMHKQSSVFQKRAEISAIMVVIATVLITLGLSLSNQESDAVGIQHGVSTLRSIQASDYLHLRTTVSGTKVGGKSTQFIDLYVKSSSIKEEDMKSEDVAIFATYTTNTTTFNITIANGRGYYLMENLEYEMVSGIDCIDQTDVPALATLVSSMMGATTMDSSAPYAGNVRDILQCNDGEILEVSWANDDYVLCVTYDEVTQESRVTEAATDGMLVTIDYDMEASVPSDIVSALSNPIPDIPDPKNANETISCGVLSFDEYENAAVSALKGRYLSSSFTRDSRTKWYEKDLTYHPGARGRRRLFSTYDFVVHATESEFDSLLSFAKNTLGCVYFCGPSSFGDTEIPLDDLHNFVRIAENSGIRKLRSLSSSSVASAAITLPRRCFFVHGAGVFDPDDDETGEIEAYRSYPLYFGQVHEADPCYCSSMHFTKLDTITKEWYNTDLQILTCRSVAVRSGQTMNHDHASGRPQDHLSIEDTVVFTHYTASLTMAAAFHNEYCTLSGSSKWATIHTPIGIDDISSVAASEATLCSKSNMEALLLKFDRYKAGFDGTNTKWKRNSFNRNMEKILSSTIAGGKTLFDVLEACTHTTERTDAGYWLATLSSANFPDDVAELYSHVQDMMVKKVSAALCGYGKYGLMQNKRFINQITQDLITEGTEASDGATSLSSCLALADLKTDVEFGDSPSDPYYATASYQTDVTEFRDSWTGERAQMKTWMDNLRMHKDLGGSHEYSGCYKDARSRVLTTRMPNSNSNGPAQCQAACAAAGNFKYFGLEYGKECHCGNGDPEKHGSARDESECNLVCPDGTDSMCGGGWRISIYKMPKPYNDLGCVNDDMYGVVIEDYFTEVSTTNNGPDACKAACEARGEPFSHFALRRGTECHCGLNPNVFRYGAKPDGDCDEPCPDNSGKTCGTLNSRNVIYRFNAYSVM